MVHFEAPTDKEVADTLKQLALSIKEAAKRGISDGTIQPDEEVYFRWKVDNFQYTDRGITEPSAHGDYFSKQSWFRGTIKLQESIKQSSEYVSALESLNSVFGESDRYSQGLERFVGRVIHGYLYDSKLEEADIQLLITTFLKDLREESVRYGAEGELQGITLKPETVTLAFGVTLRQPRIEDLEKEFPVYGFMVRQFLPNPSAILNIEFLGRAAMEIQTRVEQTIVILRLFKVGSVKWETYRMYSDSLTDMMASGTLTSGKRGAAAEICLVTEEDVARLRKFWETMVKSIPKSLFEPATIRVDHVTIGYNRYSDALLEDGSLERRIANSVMGLEALLLKPGEVQELMYRFGLRLSRLLGLLGVNPHEVKRVASDAYKVRNIFAHGGQLTYRQKKKLDSRYGDMHKLLLSVLDYLRMLLIVMILSNRGKKEFIDLIDDSFIDRKQEEKLNSIMSRAREVIG